VRPINSVRTASVRLSGADRQVSCWPCCRRRTRATAIHSTIRCNSTRARTREQLIEQTIRADHASRTKSVGLSSGSGRV